MIHKRAIHQKETGVSAEIATFALPGKTTEHHILLHVEPREEEFPGQLRRLLSLQQSLLESEELCHASVIFKRYFLSDATNQRPLMQEEQDCAVSYIQQPPLDGSKIAVWIYLIEGHRVANIDGMIVSEHNGLRHLWKMGMHEHTGDSATQTESLLIRYEEALHRFHATLADNCVRTWFFVRDVDIQYAGMVRARKQNFIEQGLTEKTHYIASTGIGGIPADTRAIIQLGTYAITGFQPSQMTYLYAPTHLNPTYEYGVTFERGTKMTYGDRSHIFISGTASINNKGEVMHVGDIRKQTERMWENVAKLLEEGGSSFDDVMQIIVYLRDLNDYAIVEKMFEQRYPGIPRVITLAPVCRPTWLIEMECIAVCQEQHDEYKDF